MNDNEMDKQLNIMSDEEYLEREKELDRELEEGLNIYQQLSKKNVGESKNSLVELIKELNRLPLNVMSDEEYLEREKEVDRELEEGFNLYLNLKGEMPNLSGSNVIKSIEQANKQNVRTKK